MIAAWTLIFASAGWVFFAYAGYPLLLLLLSRFAARPVKKEDYFPPLTLIVAVHNGEKELPEKIVNTLALDYPGEVQILFASDNSSDGTDALITNCPDERVALVRNNGARGKEAAQALAIEHASGEVLVFTDVGARLESDALRKILRPFADPSVGSVSSEDVVDSAEGEGAYVRYEMAIRRMESEVASLIGLSGSFFAVRRELATPWPTHLASDFRSALESARRGYRAVSEPEARASFRTAEDAASEWPRKVRTVRRGIAVLSEFRDLLHPRHGRVALAVWGHKAARFTSPFALVVLLVTSLAAAHFSFWAALLAGLQLLFYAVAVAGLLSPALQRSLPIRLSAFFVLVNASMLRAWAYHLSGERSVKWQPTQR